MSVARAGAARLVWMVIAAGLIAIFGSGLSGAAYPRPVGLAHARPQRGAAAGQAELQTAIGWVGAAPGREGSAAVLNRPALAPGAEVAEATADGLMPSGFSGSRQLRVRASAIAAYRQRAALERFAASLRTGEPGAVTGVWVPGILSLPVQQQPAGDPGYVSSEAETLTQFSLASALGTTGLLAHNELAGFHFFVLEPGQEIFIVYGDGTVKEYRVTAIRRFKALQPDSPFSDFLDLDRDQVGISAEALFYQVYQADDRVVLQTCIEENGISTWGRLFVIATPAGA